MRFNTAQMQELAGIRREQLRHWRKVLPPLTGRDGRADLYAFSEVLALAVIAVIVDKLGVSVSRLSECAADIFALFAEQEDISNLPAVLHLTEGGKLAFGEQPDGEGCVSVRVSSVSSRVRECLASEQRRQLPLPLRK